MVFVVYELRSVNNLVFDVECDPFTFMLYIPSLLRSFLWVMQGWPFCYHDKLNATTRKAFLDKDYH